MKRRDFMLANAFGLSAHAVRRLRTRRSVLHALAGLLAMVPASRLAIASTNRRKRVVICLNPSRAPDPIGPTRNFYSRLLAKQGFVDGEHIEIAIVRPKSDDFNPDSPEWQAIARAEVAKRPDVLVVFSTWLHFFRPLTRDIPIVFIGTIDVEHQAGVDRPGQPAGNVTGVATPFFEVQEKRFELLKELRPAARRLALVSGNGGPHNNRLVDDRLATAARRLGVEQVSIRLDEGTPAASIAETLREARVDLADFICCSSPGLFEQLVQAGVAASFTSANQVRAGGLLSYFAVGEMEILARIVGRVLRGEPVETIPAERPSRFHLAVNLRTARSLGITVPQSLLLRADEVFQ